MAMEQIEAEDYQESQNSVESDLIKQDKEFDKTIKLLADDTYKSEFIFNKLKNSKNKISNDNKKLLDILDKDNFAGVTAREKKSQNLIS